MVDDPFEHVAFLSRSKTRVHLLSHLGDHDPATRRDRRDELDTSQSRSCAPSGPGAVRVGRGGQLRGSCHEHGKARRLRVRLPAGRHRRDDVPGPIPAMGSPRRVRPETHAAPRRDYHHVEPRGSVRARQDPDRTVTRGDPGPDVPPVDRARGNQGNSRLTHRRRTRCRDSRRPGRPRDDPERREHVFLHYFVRVGPFRYAQVAVGLALFGVFFAYPEERPRETPPSGHAVAGRRRHDDWWAGFDTD